MSTFLNQYKGDTPDRPNCFPLVHFYEHLFLYNKNNNLIFNMKFTYHGSNYLGSISDDGVLEVQYQFSNQSSPSSTQITIHNLTKRDSKKFQKGCTVSLWAGWEDSDRLYNNIAQIFRSTISTVSPLQDSSGDWQMSITCQDGQKFDNETALSKLYKSESRSIRRNASGSTLGRGQIEEINKLFKGKRNILSQYMHGKRNGIQNNRKILQEARHLLTEKTKNERTKIMDIKRKIAAERHKYVIKFKNEDAALPKRDPSARKRIAAERKSIQEELQSEDRSETNASKELSNKERVARTRLSNQSKGLTEKSKHISRYGAHRRRLLQKQERHRKTQVRGKTERAKRAKSKRKTKAKKRKSSGLHFKKNTYASTIIKRLAKIGHIPISKLKLVHNKRYTSGYTATGKPFAEIQNVVSDCDSNIWWPHGQLVIGNFADHPRINFTLTPDTGLVQTPEAEDDDDSDDDDDSSTKPKNKKQQKQLQEAVPTKYDVTSVFLPFLTTGSEFMIKDPGSDMLAVQRNDNDENISAGSLFQGEVVVISGELDIESGSMPQSQFTVEYASAVRKAQSIKNKTKAQKAAQQKAAKDKKRRHRVKSKRQTRRAKRVKAKKPKVAKAKK